MSVMDYICSNYDSFFDSEQKIAKYIINNYDAVVDLTVTELAQKSGASEASVSRFCKKIGLKGFHHLKISLAKEMVETNISEEKISNDIDVNNLHQTLQNVLANKKEELTQTVSLINEKEFLEILDIINQARCVQFVAVGGTTPVALDGSFKFNEIGIMAFADAVWETQIGFTYNLTKKDVVILISNSGESTDVVNCAKAAKEVGAKTIAITNNENSSLGKASDYHITTATREKLFLDDYCFSRVSATTIIEIIYLLLTSMRDDAYKKIAQHENVIAGDKN
jgi:DNA-binding MurR/RpiR family transcriptional regulator